MLSINKRKVIPTAIEHSAAHSCQVLRRSTKGRDEISDNTLYTVTPNFGFLRAYSQKCPDASHVSLQHHLDVQRISWYCV